MKWHSHILLLGGKWPKIILNKKFTTELPEGRKEAEQKKSFTCNQNQGLCVPNDLETSP